MRRVLADQKRVILAIDGLQPDVGHEVLWVVRDCLSGEILLARSLLSATRADLTALLSQVKAACPVPVAGVVSDGQHSIRQAVAAVFPEVPYQLCQFHYLREAARPIYEADRHAKKELKKKVRGVRGIERTVEGRTGFFLLARSASEGPATMGPVVTVSHSQNAPCSRGDLPQRGEVGCTPRTVNETAGASSCISAKGDSVFGFLIVAPASEPVPQ